jgi:quercetin dioxygenase-like cupin family protein
MKRLLFVIACFALVVPASAEQGPGHVIVRPPAIQWTAAPAALPPGARSALLYGDPAKPELFVMRIWFPKGYRIAPHLHPLPEVVTVISGTLKMGFGKTAERRNTELLRAGTFMVTPANAPHYAFFDEDTVLQLSTTGPWSLTYLNPADDPRNRGSAAGRQ